MVGSSGFLGVSYKLRLFFRRNHAIGSEPNPSQCVANSPSSMFLWTDKCIFRAEVWVYQLFNEPAVGSRLAQRLSKLESQAPERPS